jgi:hypothetical protein
LSANGLCLRFASTINPEEEAMNALLLRKKKEWEFQNERYLLRLVETSADVSIESVKKAGLLTSFLMYILYKLLGVVLALLALMFKGPKLAPERTLQQLEIQVRNPFLRI